MTFSFSAWGERDTIFTMPTVSTLFFSQLPSRNLSTESESQLTDPTNARASRSPQTGLASPSFESQLASPRDKSQLTASLQKSPKFPPHRFWAWRHSHPSPIFYLGFLLWHSWLSHPPRASVNTFTNSRTVLSLTKPNDKI